MKTLQQATAERNTIMADMSQLAKELKSLLPTQYTEMRGIKKQITVGKKKLAHLKDMILYLETKPTEDFVKAEAKRLKNRKSLIEGQFQKDRVNENFLKMNLKDQTKAKTNYYKEMGMPKITTHLKSLNYLLS